MEPGGGRANAVTKWDWSEGGGWAGGAGGDRTHDRRIMRVMHSLAGSPTSANLAAVASALPSSPPSRDSPWHAHLQQIPWRVNRSHGAALSLHHPHQPHTPPP